LTAPKTADPKNRNAWAFTKCSDTSGVKMKRFLVALFLLAAPMLVKAQASASCRYYATNSTSVHACFATLAEAEGFLRDDPDGSHQTRKYLEVVGTTTDQPAADAVKFSYRVLPRRGIVWPRGYWAISAGLPNTGISCGCNDNGENAGCYPYGISYSCNSATNCPYSNHCNTKNSLKTGIESYFNSQPGNSGATVTVEGAELVNAISYTSAHVDNRSYPPNSGTLVYSGTVDGAHAGDTLRVDYLNNGNSRVARLWDHPIAPLQCPPGFNIQPGSPPSPTQACTSGESGTIIAFDVPQKPCTDKCQLYGNPVVASTGAKVQSLVGGWNDQLPEVKPTYNSLVTSSAFNPMGQGWSSLLTARFLGGASGDSSLYFSDEQGNIELFQKTVGGEYRANANPGSILRISGSGSLCRRTIFEVARRLVFNCFNGSASRLLQVDYPADPMRNLAVGWSDADLTGTGGVPLAYANTPTTITRADGRQVMLTYSLINAEANCQAGTPAHLCNVVRLTAAIGADGATTLFDYDVKARLWKITYANSVVERFEYGSVADICPQGMPGVCDATPPVGLADTLLTGVYIFASRGFETRYGTYQYDNRGRVIVTTHPGEAGRTEFRYLGDGTTSVRRFTNAGTFNDRVLSFRRIGIYNKGDAVMDKSASGTVVRATLSTTFDTNGYLRQSYDFKGARTDWTLNGDGLATQEIQAATDAGGARRTIQTDWDAARRVMTERRVYDASGTLVFRVAWTYNARDQVVAECSYDVKAAAMSYICGSSANSPVGVRQTRTTYCEQADVDVGTCPVLGLVTSVDGPRTDVGDISNYTYYASDDPSCASAPTTCPHRKGDLWKVTNAANQTTETMVYDGSGRPLSIKAPTGLVTDFEYHTRGWLTARKVRGQNNASETDDLITSIEYEPTGLVHAVTLPDGSSTSFTYDDARRLTDVTDSVGNSIHYDLDIAGHRTGEHTKNNAGVVLRTASRVFDQLGELLAVKDAYQHETGYTQDANGNPDTVTDALGHVVDVDYDPLNRLATSLHDVGGIAAETAFKYDARDNLIMVTDPKGLETNYAFSGLGDLLAVESPDTGLSSFSYDDAGNRRTQIDARGVTTSYEYDKLNRLISVAYSDGSPGVSFQYDTSSRTLCSLMGIFGSSSLGRLDKITDASGSTNYCYDTFGRVVGRKQVTNSKIFNVVYTLTPTGATSSVKYPSGARVEYTRNANGQISAATWTPAGGTPLSLITSVTYYPFGPASELMFGNGRRLTRTLNQNYQPGIVEDLRADGLSLGFEFDVVGNLLKLRSGGQLDPPLRRYVHDALGRLTEARDGATDALLQGYDYDATGNRTSATVSGVTTAYGYPLDSHRLTNVGAVTREYDDSGNTLSIGGTVKVFTYDGANRLATVSLSGGVAKNYAYTGKGEQVRRYPTTGSEPQYFVYDESGHLLGTYDANGARLQEIVWLDDLPVGVIANSQLHYIEPDHLGTPRVVIDPIRDVAVWGWPLTGEAFGDSAPNQDPDGDGMPFVLDLRFPGQRYDAATGLNQNYFRDYDPATGSYPESDPIGLNGGISTYAYSGSNPLTQADPFGLDWIEYNGRQMSLYGGKLGDRSQLKRQCAASSGQNVPGYFDYRNSAYQNVPGYGPTPEGLYSVNLVPNPNRIANVAPGGYLTPSPNGGIERIPAGGEQSWGNWRARLMPAPGTNTYGRDNMYLHDSTKGETHGCIETCSGLLNNLLQLRSAGVKAIDVFVDYPGNIRTGH
jgi:RHS repeat-associated protein